MGQNLRYPVSALALVCLWAAMLALVAGRGHNCGPNQEWASTTCDDLYCVQEGRTRDCSFIHQWQGCWCKTGYRRNQNYDCVKEAKCQDSCPSNERPVGVSSYCEYHCDTSDKCHMDQQACTCMPGFYRDTESGSCVQRDQCPRSEEDSAEPLQDD